VSIDITVNHHAEAAHRIPVLEGVGAKCRNVHGHSWRIEWTFGTAGMDLEQVEFGAIKRTLRGWIDENFDHGFACGLDDELGPLLVARGLKVMILPSWPTTEAIAGYFAAKTTELLPELELKKLVLREGFSNAATWWPDVYERPVQHVVQYAEGTVRSDPAS
jgi:6-pyruvoyltetrahydropterin/6-carboxytetrahydropterin synthase